MKRTPLRRKTPLKRTGRIKPVNRKRRGRRFARAFGGRSRVRWIQSHPCCVCGATPSECAHVVSRAAGGTADDIAPLCRTHHREQHAVGIATFQERHAVDLAEVAKELADKWTRCNAEGGPDVT